MNYLSSSIDYVAVADLTKLLEKIALLEGANQTLAADSIESKQKVALLEGVNQTLECNKNIRTH